MGQLAWIVEKFYSWSDCDGHPERVFDRDQLLDNVMLYWLTNSPQARSPIARRLIAFVIHLDESRHIQATAATAMPVETIMNRARALLLTALLVLNSSAQAAAAAATAVLYDIGFGLHALAVAFDPMREGTGRLVAAPISNLLALLGVGLLVVLGAQIVRRRR